MSQSKRPSARHRGEEKKKKKEAEDVFVEKTLELIQWAKDRSQILILAGIVAVVLVAGGVYYLNYRTSWEEQAITRLEQVQSSFNFGDRETAKADLYQYVSQFEGTAYALEARLILGQALLEDGSVQEAMDVLSPAVREMNSEPIGLQAAFLMAAAYEEDGQVQEAEDLFVRIANAADLDFQVTEALSGAARIRESRGDLEGAAEIYEELLSMSEEGDPERAFWEMRLAEVRNKA